MKTLTISWQRLLKAGRTCARCGGTGSEVRKAAATLERAMAPVGIKVRLEEFAIPHAEFERAPLESNRILIDGRSVEDWLGGATGQSPCCDLCGPNECRTVNVDGKSYETVPADLIVRAGLLAAAGLVGKVQEDQCDCASKVPAAKNGGCCGKEGEQLERRAAERVVFTARQSDRRL
jgi:hypothetical protein